MHSFLCHCEGFRITNEEKQLPREHRGCLKSIYSRGLLENFNGGPFHQIFYTGLTELFLVWGHLLKEHFFCSGFLELSGMILLY